MKKRGLVKVRKIPKNYLKVSDKDVKLLLLDKFFTQFFYIEEKEHKLREQLFNLLVLLVTFLIMFLISLINLIQDLGLPNRPLITLSFIAITITLLVYVYKARKRKLLSIYIVKHSPSYYEHLLNNLDKDWYVNFNPLYYPRRGIMPPLIHGIFTRQQLLTRLELENELQIRNK